MEKIKVSVIIPIYKVENYVDKTISSVVTQSIDGLEIILVDDGSPDSCPQKIDEWQKKDNRIKVIHKKNEGVTIARSTGLKNAIGEYIFFLDGDDYIMPGCLEKLYNAAKQNDADWVTSDFIIEYQDGRKIERHFKNYEVTDSEGFIEYCYCQHDFYFTSRLIRRSFIETAKMDVPSEITYGEDNIMVTQLGTQLKRAVKANCFSIVYVQRADSVTIRHGRKDIGQRAKACKICYDWLRTQPYFIQLKKTVDQYFISEYIGALKLGYVPKELDFVKSNCKFEHKSHSISSIMLYGLSCVNSTFTQKAVIALRKLLHK